MKMKNRLRRLEQRRQAYEKGPAKEHPMEASRWKQRKSMRAVHMPGSLNK